MDPDLTLRQIRELGRRIASAFAAGEGVIASGETLPEVACRLAELVGGLDEWLSRGGSRPVAWQYVHPLGDKHLPWPEEEVSVPKDSCEANHPTRHLQCWGKHGHEGDHFIGTDPWPVWWHDAAADKEQVDESEIQDIDDDRVMPRLERLMSEGGLRPEGPPNP